MEAVARGVRERGGVTIGILPEADRELAAPDLTFSICSGLGHGRNLCVAASGDVVIAVGGAWELSARSPSRAPSTGTSSCSARGR